MSAVAPVETTSRTPAVPNNLLIAILSAFVFFPLGALALVNAAKVNKLSADGKTEEAEAASANAKKYAYIAIITGVVVAVAGFIVKTVTATPEVAG